MKFLQGFIFLAALCFGCTKSASVCYPVVGCFYNDPPFNNVVNLPDDPANTRTDFWLFTRENKLNADILDYQNTTSINASHFNAARPTRIVIPGFSNTYSLSEYISIMKDEFLRKDDFNVLVMDYYEWAHFPNYTVAVANIRLVATQLKIILSAMQTDHGLDPKDVHLIGHSLGAHLAGYVGELFKTKDGKPLIGRISATEAAKPYFDTASPVVRLDPSDALFVDVIHTNGHAMDLSGGFGTTLQLGHTDFYVNGGKQQPGCLDGVAGAMASFVGTVINPTQHSAREEASRGASCSHGRAHDIYIESIKDVNAFTAYRCQDFDTFLTGTCLHMGGKQLYSQAGYNANQYPPQGATYLLTFDHKPYSGFHYNIVMKAAEDTPATRGNVFLSLGNLNGVGRWVNLFPSDEDLNGMTYVGQAVLFHNLLSPLQDIYLQFNREQPPLFTFTEHANDRFRNYASSFGISSLEIFVAGTQERYCITQGVTLHHGQSQRIIVQKKTEACPSFTINPSALEDPDNLFSAVVG